MNQQIDGSLFPEATLDPPGSIAVVGAGPLGIEAALYGRYLGYDIRLIEANAIASRFDPEDESPLPMLPDRSVSPLALSALRAQSDDESLLSLPTAVGAWTRQIWHRLVETDLLRGRVHCPVRVCRIGLVDVEAESDGDEDPSEEFLPDFRLEFDASDLSPSQETCMDVEAVILTVGDESGIEMKMETPCEYLFRIEASAESDAESAFRSGLKQIVAVYASLGGRADLDLYRPLRG